MAAAILATPGATSTLAAQAARAAPPVVQVDADRALAPTTSVPHIEPHLSAAPRDARRLVVAFMTPLAPDNQSHDCASLASVDGGASWTMSRMGLVGPTACADPWTAVLADGTALVVVLSDSGMIVRRSTDGGRSWPGPGVRIPGWFDHEMLVAAPTGEHVWLVAAGSSREAGRRPRPAVYVAHSADGGRSFVERGRAVLTNVAQEPVTPVLLADGALAVGTIDHHDASNRRLERRRAWVVVSRDSGATYTAPSLVTESCSRTRFTAWPSLAATPARDGRPERLFFTCEADGNHGVLFARSDDQGDRWTAARRIDGGADSGWTKTPTMAVSAGGLLAVTWLDARDARDDATARCWHLYGTVSLDGGETFLAPQRLSGAPSCPTADRTGEGVLGRFPSGGEYHGLAALGPREFVAVWPDARDGRFQLRSVRFRVPEQQ